MGNTTFPTCAVNGAEQYQFPYLCCRRSCLSSITWAIPFSLPVLSTEPSNTTFPTYAVDGAASVVSHWQYHFPCLCCKRAGQYHFPYLCWAIPLSLPVLLMELGNTTFHTCAVNRAEQYHFPYLCCRQSWAIPLSLLVLSTELGNTTFPTCAVDGAYYMGNTTFPTCAVDGAGQYHFPYLCCQQS